LTDSYFEFVFVVILSAELLYPKIHRFKRSLSSLTWGL